MTGLLIFCASASVATALVAGVLLVFSDFVMRALRKSGPSAGILAMQMINREIYRSVTMTLFVGMAVLSAAATVYALFVLDSAASSWIAAGGLLYLLGVLMVTGLGNVPLNERLDGHDAESSAGEAFWTQTYLPRWVRLNWIRVLAGTASSGCFLIACLHL